VSSLGYIAAAEILDRSLSGAYGVARSWQPPGLSLLGNS
jgi:hypothetical protein